MVEKNIKSGQDFPVHALGSDIADVQQFTNQLLRLVTQSNAIGLFLLENGFLHSLYLLLETNSAPHILMNLLKIVLQLHHPRNQIFWKSNPDQVDQLLVEIKPLKASRSVLVGELVLRLVNTCMSYK